MSLAIMPEMVSKGFSVTHCGNGIDRAAQFIAEGL